jgi:hypothetical protein
VAAIEELYALIHGVHLWKEEVQLAAPPQNLTNSLDDEKRRRSDVRI